MTRIASALFLFDLDGTLVTTGGAGLRALARSFADLYGVHDVLSKIDPSGKTDPAIFREIFRVCLNKEMTPSELEIVSHAYLCQLEWELKNPSSYRVCPGVMEFISFLSSQENVLLGLGTGNLEKGARLKLGPSGLNARFDFGGFGSDSEDRPELLRIGRSRAESRGHSQIPNEHVYVVGDTELDVAAAKSAGFKSVAVATGSRSRTQLEGSKPDFLFNNLLEGERALEQVYNNGISGLPGGFHNSVEVHP